ncbi:MAG: sigma 54-interacting transcriptional regulator [Candidatus Sumerlaeota bacterium]|nr:sigma 54-interacting transcriptional regulator [Candidatus Sumerlaeota bacterium]
MTALHKIALILAGAAPLREVLRQVLDILSSDLGMRRGMISILRRDLKEVYVDIGHGLESAVGEGLTYRLGEGVTGTVVETGRPIAIPRLDKSPLFLDRSKTRRHLNRAELAFLCVPIKLEEEVVGALSADQVNYGLEGDLSDEVRLLEAVARLLAPLVRERRIQDENDRLRIMMSPRAPGPLIGNSEAMAEVSRQVLQVADSRTSVLITGETGTGKSLVATEIHRHSPRRSGPLVKVSCGAIPENLIESELFGHEKGSFTGAVDRHIGRFEQANGGTIFLDEVGELPPAAQVKLLTVLQDREIQRVGGAKPIRVNVRVVAATNRNLEDDVQAGRFRADLFYRLNVFPIHIPPLRDRGADIMLLADYFVQKYAKELEKKVNRIDTPAIDMLMSYHWPGNVRELENCIERAVLVSLDDTIHAHCLPPSLQMKTPQARKHSHGKFEALVAAYEIELLTDALKDTHGNQAEAARLLGATKRIVQYKVRTYGIDYMRFRRKRGGNSSHADYQLQDA